jgi:hypothetical protein
MPLNWLRRGTRVPWTVAASLSYPEAAGALTLRGGGVRCRPNKADESQCVEVRLKWPERARAETY